MILIP